MKKKQDESWDRIIRNSESNLRGRAIHSLFSSFLRANGGPIVYSDEDKDERTEKFREQIAVMCKALSWPESAIDYIAWIENALAIHLHADACRRLDEEEAAEDEEVEENELAGP